MVRTTLPEVLVEAGRRLVQALDEAGMEPGVALWLYDDELQEWRLVLASADVATQGPRPLYARVQEFLRGAGGEPVPFRLDDVSVRPLSDPLVKALRAEHRTGPEISGYRFSRSAVQGHFIDDAYIYRLH